jgi:stage V sporulation protein AC
VFLSALLTGLNVYEQHRQARRRRHPSSHYRFCQRGGSPALEFKNEGLILGVGAKMFVIAGPVIVYGFQAA